MPSVSPPRSPSSVAPTGSASPGAGLTALTSNRFKGNTTLQQVAAGQTTLANGAGGEAVTLIQTALLDMGFALKPYKSKISGNMVGGVDGSFGGQTKRALENFQRHASKLRPGITVNGVLDQNTLKALDALAPSPGAKSWSAGETPKVPRPIWNNDSSKKLRCVVLKSEHRTFLYDAQGKCTGIFSNSVGKVQTPTHNGIKKVTGKLGQAQAEATGVALWNDKKAFGMRILDLSWADGRANPKSGEELHGTYAYDQMGQDVSHGCVRHYNEDVLRLYDSLAVGDLVAIVDSIDDPRIKPV